MEVYLYLYSNYDWIFQIANYILAIAFLCSLQPFAELWDLYGSATVSVNKKLNSGMTIVLPEDNMLQYGGKIQ